MNQSDDIFRLLLLLLLLLSKYRSPLLEFFFFVLIFSFSFFLFPLLSKTGINQFSSSSSFFFSFFLLLLVLCYCCFRLFSCILEVLVFLFSLLFTHLKITLYYIDLINMISFLFRIFRTL